MQRCSVKPGVASIVASSFRMSEFHWCRTGPSSTFRVHLAGISAPVPVLWFLLHEHKHFPVWMSCGCHVHRQQVPSALSHMFDVCHWPHAAWLLDARCCVILSKEHFCETKLLL